MIRLVLLLVGAFVVYRVTQVFIGRLLEKKLHCKPVKELPKTSLLSWLGLNIIFNFKELTSEGGIYKVVQQQFQSLGVTTFKTNDMFKTQIITIDPENIRHALSTANMKNWGTGYRPIALKPLLGDGIFSSEGESWKHSRIMLRPVFAKEHIKQITAMESYTKLLIKLIENKKGQPLDLQTLFHHFTIDYATDFLFGESCDCLKDLLGEETTSTLDVTLKISFASNFSRAQEQMTLRLLLGPLSFLVYPRSLREAVRKQHEFVDHFIEKAIAMSDDELENHPKSYVFLYQLVKQTKDRKVLRDELLSILLAGRSTTASLLSFLFYELSHHKDAFEKLKEEIRAHFPDVDSITFESIQNCDYLRWCINETLRVDPSVPFNLRAATTDTVLPRGGGPDCSDPILVRKGESVLLPLYASNRQEKYFGPDTEKFSPERWKNLPRSGGAAFMPFSTGARLCLGQLLAQVEASYVTIRLLQTFNELDSATQEYPPKRTVGPTMRLKNGCQVSLS